MINILIIAIITTMFTQPTLLSEKPTEVQAKNKNVTVEKVVGRVKNNNGDGQILDNSPYDYINYKGKIDCKKGDLIVTYLYYDARNDVVARLDSRF